jgi:molecular chaperone IbpA
MIGFDRMFVELANASHTTQSATYPPHNIIKYDEDNYEIEMALAGFAKDEINVEFSDGQLTVNGKKETDTTKNYIYKGLATRSFTKTLALSDYIEVKGAEFLNGILTIQLERVIPDALKPKSIKIK